MPTTVTASQSACKPRRRKSEAVYIGSGSEAFAADMKCGQWGTCGRNSRRQKRLHSREMHVREEPAWTWARARSRCLPTAPRFRLNASFCDLIPTRPSDHAIESLRNNGAARVYTLPPKCSLAYCSHACRMGQKRARTVGCTGPARRDGIVPLPVSPLSAQSPSICSPRTL